MSMRTFIAIACVFIVANPISAAFANSGNATVSRVEQRAFYRDALQHIKGGQRARVQQIKGQLADYPLLPYIEYTEKIYNLSRQSPESILSFVDRYGDSPIADQLLINWLFVLAKQGNWKLFLQHYRQDLPGQRNACFHAWALYKTGAKEQAFAVARKLWRVPWSQPEECDPVFKAWRDANQLDDEIAWDRFALTLKSNEVSLASYLMRYLADSDKTLANNFKQVQVNPATIKRTGLFKRDDQKTRDIILHGLKRLSYRDSPAALDLLGKYASSHSFNPVELEEAYANIGIQIAVAGDPNGLLDSMPTDLNQSPALVEARIRLALRRQDWSNALVLMNLLPDNMQASPRWQYWKARVLIGTVDGNDRTTAREMFESIAKTRNFYGFLAADILGAEYQFEDSPALIEATEIEGIEQLPGIQRALELFVLEDFTRARREWNAATRNLGDHGLQIAARVAANWGWHRESIMSMVNAEAWNDLDVRFPLAYHESFVSNARAWDIPLTFSIAIARQESAFMTDAKSSAGALGVMQLMPATARQTAERHGLGATNSNNLADPAFNIKLGSAYLGQMLRRYDSNRILASAAYNAGPGRVDKWIDPSLPVDVWVETIPFTETRNYVQNVLMFTTIYARRLSEKQPLIFAHELRQFSNQQISLTGQPTAVIPPDNS